MIGYLTGTIIYSDLKSILLNVNGVGYKVFTNTAMLHSDVTGPTSFWTYLAVRETALDLYGFGSKAELDFFELLLTISGIGPKSAHTILSVATISNLRQAITSGDTSHLTKVSGIGKKVAEKIVLELKDKIEGLESEKHGNISGDIDALLALQSFGYSERDAREALKHVTGESTKEKIRGALKNLNK